MQLARSTALTTRTLRIAVASPEQANADPDRVRGYGLRLQPSRQQHKSPLLREEAAAPGGEAAQGGTVPDAAIRRRAAHPGWPGVGWGVSEELTESEIAARLAEVRGR